MGELGCNQHSISHTPHNLTHKVIIEMKAPDVKCRTGTLELTESTNQTGLEGKNDDFYFARSKQSRRQNTKSKRYYDTLTGML